jgi:hypothetical protein
MDHIFFNLAWVFIYLDHLLIASCTAEDSRQHVQEELRWLDENRLGLNVEKCMWGQCSLNFLGHKVTDACISPLPDRM